MDQFTLDEHLGCFQSGVLLNNDAVKILVLAFLCTFPWGVNLEVEHW